MRLYEEYLARHGLVSNGARHVRKGFAYMRGGDRLLAIQWDDVGPHPGFYSISECVLGNSCRVLKSHKVTWDDYEGFLIGLVGGSRPLVTDRSMVFSLTWEYFIRRHEELVRGIFPLSDIVRTLDSRNESRLLDCMGLLESLGKSAPAAADFWHSRAFSIVDSYCYWMGGL